MRSLISCFLPITDLATSGSSYVTNPKPRPLCVTLSAARPTPVNRGPVNRDLDFFRPRVEVRARQFRGCVGVGLQRGLVLRGGWGRTPHDDDIRENAKLLEMFLEVNLGRVDSDTADEQLPARRQVVGGGQGAGEAAMQPRIPGSGWGAW